jgi:lipoprotein-releasing system ATP-binding protein
VTDAAIEADGLCRVLREAVPVTLVEGVTFAIGAGELVAITGPSGSGKSSLLYLLGLLDRPTSGEVRLLGRPTGRLPEEDRARLRLERLGFVFQFHFLLPEFTAAENVMLPMRAFGRLSHGETARRAASLLEAFGLEAHREKLPGQLSGGQRQRVAVARALANDPPVVLADEPTGNLDSASTEQVFAMLRDLALAGGKTVLIVTHDLQLARRCSRRIELIDGRIVVDRREAT